ncbi:hypothetical protein EV421DRAFT_1912522 [Armillaria borealis]|uniref:Uncharacterized protein n=1 Tax=Armillaria borealis TaxID=47425 RepID=A0AA39IX36_9AGAR|nr:hypothetical protein EV421DRAFT_1912522 [Armillaria borealis]
MPGPSRQQNARPTSAEEHGDILRQFFHTPSPAPPYEHLYEPLPRPGQYSRRPERILVSTEPRPRIPDACPAPQHGDPFLTTPFHPYVPPHLRHQRILAGVFPSDSSSSDTGSLDSLAELFEQQDRDDQIALARQNANDPLNEFGGDYNWPSLADIDRELLGPQCSEAWKIRQRNNSTSPVSEVIMYPDSRTPQKHSKHEPSQTTSEHYTCPPQGTNYMGYEDECLTSSSHLQPLSSLSLATWETNPTWTVPTTFNLSEPGTFGGLDKVTHQGGPKTAFLLGGGNAINNEEGGSGALPRPTLTERKQADAKLCSAEKQQRARQLKREYEAAQDEAIGFDKVWGFNAPLPYDDDDPKGKCLDRGHPCIPNPQRPLHEWSDHYSIPCPPPGKGRKYPMPQPVGATPEDTAYLGIKPILMQPPKLFKGAHDNIE